MKVRRTAKSKVKTAMDALLDLFKPRAAKAPPDHKRCYRCGSKFKVRVQKPEDAYDTTAYCQEACSFITAPSDGRKSRQESRAELRKEAHKHINQVAGGEPRRVRRAMARSLGNRRFAERAK